MTIDRVKLIGDVVTATGVLHLGLGVLAFGPPLAEMLGAGVVNTLSASTERQATLWFMVAGGFLVTAGLSIRWVRARTGLVPVPLAWGLLAIAAIGALVAPVSGFWLVLVEAIALLVAARRPQPAVAHG